MNWENHLFKASVGVFAAAFLVIYSCQEPEFDDTRTYTSGPVNQQSGDATNSKKQSKDVPVPIMTEEVVSTEPGDDTTGPQTVVEDTLDENTEDGAVTDDEAAVMTTGVLATISWDPVAADSGITGYEVYGTLKALDQYVKLTDLTVADGTVDLAAPSYTLDIDAANNDMYSAYYGQEACFYVVAVNVNGPSQPSPEQCVILQ